MTLDRVAMKELLEKGSDQDLLREMMAFVVSRMMDVEVESLTGAAHGARTADRMNQRNGYRAREWHTGVGTVPVAIPKLRKGSYFPSFLEARRSADKAMIAVIQEAYIHGVSTRSVDDLVKAMGMTGISKSQVSRLCEDIDGRVKQFLNRPIEGHWPYVWIDATYVKNREGGRIVSVATIVAVGVNTDGRREVLGMSNGPSEAEPFWTQFLRSLTARGLRGVKLVISDAHEGIKAATKKVFQASWQRCRVGSLKKFERSDSLLLVIRDWRDATCWDTRNGINWSCSSPARSDSSSPMSTCWFGSTAFSIFPGLGRKSRIVIAWVMAGQGLIQRLACD